MFPPAKDLGVGLAISFIPDAAAPYVHTVNDTLRLRAWEGPPKGLTYYSLPNSHSNWPLGIQIISSPV